MNLLDRFFPYWQINNVRLFYILSAVYNFWIMAAVWVFIWGKFMTKTEIGISDSITFAIGFLVELPSGVFADVIGRKKAIVIGNLLMMAGNFLIGIGSSFIGITVFYLFWTIGYAFQSGATEALVYDTLKRKGLEKEWHKVISSATVVSKSATLIATSLGGFLFIAWFRLPYLAAAVIGIVGVLAAFSLDEIRMKKTKKIWSVSTYLIQIKDGLSTLIRKNVFPFALIGLVVVGVGYMYNWGILRPLTAERFGYTPAHYALLLSASSLTGILGVGLLPRIKKHFTLEKLIFLISLLYTIVFFSMGFNFGFILGGTIMVLLSLFLLYMEILFSQFINLHTKEEHRATTLSAIALFTRLPYVLLALLIGKLADINLLPQYTLVVGTIATLVWVFAFSLRKYVFKEKDLR